eukprot:jgi/Chrpa1/4837/Chrysochromulina_OHIO_Genome00014225-RA
MSRPPSATHCTALSRKGAAVPYGSISTASKRGQSGGFERCITATASPRLGMTTSSVSPLRFTFSLRAASAVGSRSLATTLSTSGISSTYRNARSPEAVIASSTRMRRGPAAEVGPDGASGAASASGAGSDSSAAAAS